MEPGPKERSILNACLEFSEMLRKQGKIAYRRIYTGPVVRGGGKGPVRFTKNPAAGMPDFVVVLAPNGKTLWCETKRWKGGRQSPDQKRFQGDIESVGGFYCLISSLAEYVRILSIWGVEP